MAPAEPPNPVFWRCANQVSWLIDGELVRTEKHNVPTGPMYLHLNLWVPDSDWPEAYDSSLQPTSSVDSNQVFSMSVDSVNVGQDLWHGAVDLGSGWKWVNWFGYFNTSSDPWIYHEYLGWLYAFGTATDDLVFWDPHMNAFWWTSQSQYPYAYRFSDGAWLYYLVGSANPRWFYNYSSETWESD
jgi:hypothetical protein